MLPTARVTVVIPTLTAGQALAECLDALERQSWRDFDVVVVDNSGRGLVRAQQDRRAGVTILENDHNTGFGAAVNRGFRASSAEFLATLNDDALAGSDWLAELMAAAAAAPSCGMWASQIRLAGLGTLDSAGLLLAADGSSKQRGHGRPPEEYAHGEEALLPSGCAALYRRRMLEETGLFDESFFLYCEDTDLGLRGRWAGWDCLYVPRAVVQHHYSLSAGRASALKARLVERNRLFLVVKNFPPLMLWRVGFASLLRYSWHLLAMASGRGAAGRFRAGGRSGLLLAGYVLRAHGETLLHLPRLWRQRRAIRATARLSPSAFRHLVACHSISLREVAAQ